MEKIRTPTYVRLVGFAGDNLEARARVRFADLIRDVGAQVALCDEQKNPIVATRKAFNAVYEIHLKLLVGNDYCVHQIWATSEDNNYRGTWAEPERIVRGFQLSGEDVSLFETGVSVCGEPITASTIAGVFDSVDVARSLIRSSALEILMIEADGTGARYWVSPSKQQGNDASSPSRGEKRRISETIDDIARIEVYRNKISGFYKSYPGIHKDLSRIEAEVSEQLKVATRNLREAKPFELKDTLYQVSQKFVEIAAIARALETDSHSTASNLSNLQSVFRRWGEQSVADFSPVSTMLLASTELIPEAYARLAKKVEAVRVEMNNVTEVIRAKVDLEQQGDILLIQRGLDWLQVIVLTDIFFRFGTEVLLQETVRESLPIVRELQPLALLACSFILALFITQGVKWAVKRMAKR